MPYRFPDQSHSSLADEKPEEAGDGDWELREIITVDIDIDEQADEGASTDKQRPVPLPSSSDRVESLLPRKIRLAMLGQTRERQDERNCVKHGKTDAEVSTRADVLDGDVAFRSVDEGAVVEEQDGLVGLKGQVALGAVGQGAIVVVCVVEVLEGCEVEVDVSEDGISVVVAVGEGDEVSGVEDFGLVAHCGGLRGCNRSISIRSKYLNRVVSRNSSIVCNRSSKSWSTPFGNQWPPLSRLGRIALNAALGNMM